jgi:DNA polymerase III delta subunit
MAPRAVSDARVLLLHGEESFLVEEEARRVLDAWRAELVSDFGFEALDPGALTAAKLRDAVRQLPFLDPYRVIAVRSVPARRAEGLAAGLKEIPDTTRILLTVSGRVGAGSALGKAVAAADQGLSREFPRLKGRALGDWASDRARSLGLPPSIAPMVLRASPADLGVIDSELRKLVSYHASGFPLDRDALTALLAGGHEEEVFRLTDNLLPRPSGEAFRVARSLVRSGESPTTLAYRVSRQLAMVLAVRARRDRGESLAEVQAAMSEHPFRVQKAFEAAGSVDADQLEEGLKALLAYEWEVKSGQLDAEHGLDGVLARL